MLADKGKHIGMLCYAMCIACTPSHLPLSLTLPVRSYFVFGRSVIYLCTVATPPGEPGVTGVLGWVDPEERILYLT